MVFPEPRYVSMHITYRTGKLLSQLRFEIKKQGLDEFGKETYFMKYNDIRSLWELVPRHFHL